MRTLFAALLARGAVRHCRHRRCAPRPSAKSTPRAKGEGALSIYGGGPARLYEGWVKEYEARFPGIKVQVTGGYAGGLAPAIDKQIAEGKLDVDFVTFQAVQEFIRWKREGAAAAVQDGRVRGARSALPRCGRRLRARSTCSRSRRPSIPKLVAREDAPRSALDFLKPMFHGKLITAYPNDDDATLFAFQTIVRNTAGSTWTTHMATAPKFIQGHLGGGPQRGRW